MQAAATGALLGCVLAGPVGGALFGGAGYYAATRPESSKVGNAARAFGTTAVLTYRAAKKAAKSNKLGDKVKKAAGISSCGCNNKNCGAATMQ
jgi:hypothetical protein